MSELIKAFSLSCFFTRTICITNSTTVELVNDDDFELLLGRQRFVLHPNFIAIAGYSGLGSQWIEILKSDKLEVEPEAGIAVVLPYRVPASDKLLIYDELYGYYVSFPMERGTYNILAEIRELTEEEVSNIPEYASDYLPVEGPYHEFPELVRLTFIPTKKLGKPKQLKRGNRKEDIVPSSELVVFEENRAEDRDPTRASPQVIE